MHIFIMTTTLFERKNGYRTISKVAINRLNHKLETLECIFSY